MIQDVQSAIDQDWEEFSRAYAQERPVAEKKGKKELMASRLGSIIFVLREKIRDRKKVVQIVDILETYSKKVEEETGVSGLWDRAIDYFRTIDQDSVKGRDAKLWDTILEKPNDDFALKVAFESDMVQLVSRYVNVVQYCDEFGIK